MTPAAWSGLLKTPQLSLDQALAQYDRAEAKAGWARQLEVIAQVQRDFPLDEWPTLPIERYALGTPSSKQGFSWMMEFGTPDLCSIKGGAAKKHLIYLHKTGEWYFDAAYPDHLQAWAALREGFFEAFTAARENRLTDIDQIDVLRSGPALTAKAAFCYAPDALLPVASHAHVNHFVALLSQGTVDATGQAPFTAHTQLKQLVDDDPRFHGWGLGEVMGFLYFWADPRNSTTVLKIAPGHLAAYWEQCVEGGYICLGWDEVGDLTAFTAKEDFAEAFGEAFSEKYNGVKTKISAKANEVWRLFELQPGDRVVANRGTSEILGVGTVVEPGYVWRPERERYKHTVSVTWDQSYAQTLADPQKSWATVTVAKIAQPLWHTIHNSAGKAPGNTTDPQFDKLKMLLERKGQVVLYGPPGTGKTHTALVFALNWLASRLAEPRVDAQATYGTTAFRDAVNALSKSGHLTQVTFHPAYGYEDFIEGFRPVAAVGGGFLNLDLVDGIFKQVCDAAAGHPELPYLVVIDEINRGDIPKIFGELITLLEQDKRGLDTRLALSGRAFQVPPNVYVLGTMNTADRSIRLLDSALRRRFAFQELLPNLDLLDGNTVAQLDLGLMLRELNRRIVAKLGRERQVGHSFFLTGGRAISEESELAAVVRTEVLPLLQEYAYDDYPLLAEFLGKAIIDIEHHTLKELDDAELVDALYAHLQVGADQQR